jgi:hypothetical protein
MKFFFLTDNVTTATLDIYEIETWTGQVCSKKVPVQNVLLGKSNLSAGLFARASETQARGLPREIARQ